MIKKARRHTIMDGSVVTFARDFDEYDHYPPLNPNCKAKGGIEVSASRNRVTVHKADLHTNRDKRILQQIIELAWHEKKKLKACNGRPNDNWDGSPKEIKMKAKT